MTSSLASPVTWLVGQWVPELRRFPHGLARRAALARAMTAVQRHRWFLPKFLSALVASVAIPLAAYERGFVSASAMARLIGLLFPTTYVAVPCCFVPFMRRSFRQQLRDHGVPICIPCGYDLTGNVTGRCPECGHAFTSNSIAAEDVSNSERPS